MPGSWNSRFPRIDPDQHSICHACNPLGLKSNGWNRGPRAHFDDRKSMSILKNLVHPVALPQALLMGAFLNPVQVVEHKNVRSGQPTAIRTMWQWFPCFELGLVNLNFDSRGVPDDVTTVLHTLEVMN